MITAVHTLVYPDAPETARAFFRDVLDWPHVDAHGGWLIFKTGPSELGVHPTSKQQGGEVWSTHQHHQISFMCDDVTLTVCQRSWFSWGSCGSLDPEIARYPLS